MNLISQKFSWFQSLDNYIPINVNAVETLEDRKKQELLIIEDDDTLGSYLKDVLSTNYRVII